MLATLFRVLEQAIDDDSQFLASDPRHLLLHHVQQDAKRLIYTAIQYFMPGLTDRVHYLIETIPKLTAGVATRPSVQTRVWIILRYFINHPTAVAAIGCASLTRACQ